MKTTRNIIVKCNTPSPSGPHGWGKICKKAISLKISFYTPTHVGKKKLHDNHVHIALYQNFYIHGPWVRSSGPRAIWLYSMHKILEKLSLLPYIVEKNYINA